MNLAEQLCLSGAAVSIAHDIHRFIWFLPRTSELRSLLNGSHPTNAPAGGFFTPAPLRPSPARAK
jgi:hypothetical protein